MRICDIVCISAREDQAYDLIYIDYEDNILRAENIDTRTQAGVPDKKYAFIQFKLPGEAISDDSIEVHIHSKGAMDYYWTIILDINQLMDKLPFDLNVIREEFAKDSILRYENYLRRQMIDNILELMPTYFLICLDVGILLSLRLGNRDETYSYYAYYGYKKMRAFSARMNGYHSKRSSQDVFDGYSKSRI